MKSGWVVKLFFRSGDEIREQKKIRSGQYGNTWYLRNGVTNTIQVMSTPRSELASKLQSSLSDKAGPDGGKFKVIEKAGPSIQTGLSSAKIKINPCPYKDKCLVSNEDNCSQSKIVYQVICNICEKDDNSGSVSSLQGADQPD